MATGFYTTEQPIAEHIKGRDGRTLADAWREHGHGGVQGHHDRRLPQPLPDRRPQHRARALVHGLHHREPDRLHPSPRSSRWASASSAPSSRRPRRSSRGTTTSSDGCSARCGAPAAARAGTSTPTAATRRCGRARRSSSASCCSRFDLDQYVVTPRHDAIDHEGARSMTATHMTSLDNKVVVITGAGSGIGPRARPAGRPQGCPARRSPTGTSRRSPRPSTCSRPPVCASCAATSSTSPTAPRSAGWADGGGRAVRPRQHAGQQRRRHRHRRLRGDVLRGLRLDRRRQLRWASSTAPRSSCPT